MARPSLYDRVIRGGASRIQWTPAARRSGLLQFHRIRTQEDEKEEYSTFASASASTGKSANAKAEDPRRRRPQSSVTTASGDRHASDSALGERRRRRAQGRVTVTVGRSLISRVLRVVAGLPSAIENGRFAQTITPVNPSRRRSAHSEDADIIDEDWVRYFGGGGGDGGGDDNDVNGTGQTVLYSTQSCDHGDDGEPLLTESTFPRWFGGLVGVHVHMVTRPLRPPLPAESSVEPAKSEASNELAGRWADTDSAMGLSMSASRVSVSLVAHKVRFALPRRMTPLIRGFSAPLAMAEESQDGGWRFEVVVRSPPLPRRELVVKYSGTMQQC